MVKTYFCSACKRNHRENTAVYKKHIKLKKIEEDEVSSTKVISCDFRRLRYIAQRQIDRYLNKIIWDKENNYSRNKRMYVQQINKLIMSELGIS